MISQETWTILDVRSRTEFGICHLKDSISERVCYAFECKYSTVM